MKKKSGFTILELAVTVIIIAVIAVVALPMYKHAILKSRFSTVMPMAKAVADAQEIYYLGNNQYALGKEDLDIAPVEAENTQVSLSPAEEDEEYIYVAAHRTDIPNVRYIMYQKNSPKFASNIHCEADANDEDALWLCEKALHGTEVTGSLQGKNYKTFLLAGDLGGSSFKVCPENAVCNDEGNVTGCADGYYQEEQTCKEEKTCDSAQEFIRTSCEEDCGEEVKQGTCNVKTGEWENYTVTQACPTKPPLTKACSELGKGWTSGTAQGSTQCSGGSWAEPTWDETDCKKECTGEQPLDKQLCQEEGKCGWETREVTCNYKTGEWIEPEWNTEGCSSAPADPTRNCHDQDSNTCGTQTNSYTCSAQGTWELGEWSNTCIDKPADYTDRCDSGQNGRRTYTYVCNSSGTGWTQVKSSTCTTVSAGGTFSDQNGCSAATNGTCAGGYTFTNRAWCYAYVGEGRCDNNNFSEHSHCYSGTSASCRNGTYTEGSWCMTGAVVTSTGLCQGGTYSTSSYCQGNYGTGACSGATYQTNSYCVGGNETSCTGNTFKTGTYCYAKKAGACANNTYEGTACCYATSTGLCPSGSRKCNSSHVWDNTYW